MKERVKVDDLVSVYYWYDLDFLYEDIYFEEFILFFLVLRKCG